MAHLFEQYKCRSSNPRLEELFLALIRVLQMFPRVYLVVDALDECADNTRRELVAHLAELYRKTGLRILATGRPTLDFKKEFGECEKLEIKADVADVKTVLNVLIDKSDSFVRTDAELRKRVMDNAAAAADGM